MREGIINIKFATKVRTLSRIIVQDITVKSNPNLKGVPCNEIVTQ